MSSPTPRRAQSEPLPSGGPRHAVTAPAAAQPSTAGAVVAGSVLDQRLQGAFLAIIGLAGLVGGVMFSIEAPRFTPVPVVFLTFWLVMVVVGRILFTGLDKLRAAGVGAPAPSQVRAAAAVAAIVVAVGMMGFAPTSVGTGTAVAAPCPGGGPPTCGPDPGGPTLTFTQPPGQTITPGGGQPGLPGGQQGGIVTSPTRGGGGNGSGIQAQTPQFGTPGQQAPNIPGNEPPGQPGQGGQQPQGTQAQQSPARTTAPGGPQQTEGQPTSSGQQPTQSTVTVTQTQSQCPAPGAGGNGGAGGPGNGEPGNDGGITGGPDSGGNDGLPSWAYLVAEATGVLAGRRRLPGGGTGLPVSTSPGPGTVLTDGQVASKDTSAVLRSSDEFLADYDIVDFDNGDTTGNTTAAEVDRANNDDPLRGVSPRRPLTPIEKLAQAILRGRTPSKSARDRVKGNSDYGVGKPDPAFDGVTQIADPDADHLIPVSLLPQIPGFPYLPPDDMVRIAEMLDDDELSNIYPASPSENRSRQNKLWQEYERHRRLGEVDEALKKLRELQTLQILPKIRQQIIDTLLDPNNLENLKDFLRSMGFTEEQIREFMKMSAEQQRDVITRLVNGLPPKPLELDPIPSEPSEVSPKPGVPGEGGATVPPIPSLTPDRSGAGAGTGSASALPSQADMPQTARPPNPNIDLSGVPLGAKPTVHARQMLPDGWEPPNSSQRDLAWARYNGAQPGGDPATIMEAWNAWLIADHAYQQAVQQHWQAQGWAGSAPQLTPICFVSRVDPASVLSPTQQIAQAAQEAAAAAEAGSSGLTAGASAGSELGRIG